MELDVLCIGLAVYDLTYSVDHHPGEDEKCFASGLTAGGGGPAANAALTVARLGGKAALAGYLGEDVFGTLHLAELQEAGVRTDFVLRGKHPTPLSAIFAKPDGKRTVVNYRGSPPSLDPHLTDLDAIRPRTLLFDGHEPEISFELAAEARKRKIPTILDAGSVNSGTVALAPLCTHLAASETFALKYTGRKNPEEAMEVLSGLAPIAVVTLGAEGLLWSAGGGSGRIPAFPVDAVDTTGAGDIFHGAFAFRTARGESLSAALRYASAAAALGCTKMGARQGIPEAREVEEFLRGR